MLLVSWKSQLRKLYNHPHANDDQNQEHQCRGTKLIIKEPYFKLSNESSGTPNKFTKFYDMVRTLGTLRNEKEPKEFLSVLLPYSHYYTKSTFLLKYQMMEDQLYHVRKALL